MLPNYSKLKREYNFFNFKLVIFKTCKNKTSCWMNNEWYMKYALQTLQCMTGKQATKSYLPL